MLHAEVKKIITSSPVCASVAEVMFFALEGHYSKKIENLDTIPFCVGITTDERNACMIMMDELHEDAHRA